MKNGLMLLLLLFAGSTNLMSQENSNPTIPLIGSDAPTFTTQTTNGTLDFPKDYGNNWKIIFSHPRDFTPVCSSELLELANLQPDFELLKTKILVVSTDELQKHKLWKSELESISYKNRQPTKINFPLADDNSMQISRKYGMLHEPVSNSRDVRGVFIIGPKNKVEAVFFYPMNIGRNMDEIKRTLVALQSAGKGKDHMLTPANWQAGDDMLMPQFPYTEKQAKENPAIKDAYYNVGSYMWFKKAGIPVSQNKAAEQ